MTDIDNCRCEGNLGFKDEPTGHSVIKLLDALLVGVVLGLLALLVCLFTMDYTLFLSGNASPVKREEVRPATQATEMARAPADHSGGLI